MPEKKVPPRKPPIRYGIMPLAFFELGWFVMIVTVTALSGLFQLARWLFRAF